MARQADSGPDNQLITFEAGTVDLGSGEFQAADGAKVLLAPRPLALLRALVAQRGTVLSRDEILEQVWGHREAGSDDAVNVTVSSLRKMLGDVERPFTIVQTVPRRGYRYVGPEPDADEPIAPPDPVVAAVSERSRRGWPFALAALGALVALAIWLLPRSEGPEPAVVERALPDEPSVAVLPFLDAPGSDDQIFADGLVDTVLHQLAQIDGLHVVARTSTFALRGSDATVDEIGRQLGVAHILEGSVQRADNRLRVIAQLIDARDGAHIWSRTYDRELGGIFEIQDDIAAAVAQAMRATLMPPADGPRDLAYFEQMALGRHELDKETSDGAALARAHFEKALEIAPDEPEAMLMLAEAMATFARLNSWPVDERFEEFVALVDRANELAPNDPLAVLMKGRVHFIRGDREQAERLFEQSIALNPNFAYGHFTLGRTLWRRGAFDEALERLLVAHRLDPLSELVNTRLADAYWSVGRAEEAVARLRENIERNPAYPPNYDRLATYLIQLGRTGESMRYIERQLELDPASGMRKFRVCEFHLQLADDDSAETCADELERSYDMPDRILYLRQAIAAARGEWDRQRALALELHERYPEMELIPVLVALGHASVDCGTVLDVLSTAYPSMFADAPTVAPMYTLGAQNAVYCLRKTGDEQQAERLLEAVDDTIERIRVARGPHYMSGIENAVQHALRGKHDDALNEIERMVRNGWRYYWWGLESYAMFQPIVGTPRWEAAMRELRSGVEAERATYEAQRGLPLGAES